MGTRSALQRQPLVIGATRPRDGGSVRLRRIGRGEDPDAVRLPVVARGAQAINRPGKRKLRGAQAGDEVAAPRAPSLLHGPQHRIDRRGALVKREDLPTDQLEKEKEIYRAQFAGQNKPANVIEKIVEGKIESYYSQVCLMDQPSVRDPNVTIKQMVAAATAKTGENVTISRFVRFKLGETIEQ